ncbi:MAG: hypothetical protein EXS37_06835 [Opitutus sp.]|nr:hypothetical protein [Opitutus sp.]
MSTAIANIERPDPARMAPVYYTRSKDHGKVYAIATEWPGKESKLKAVTPKPGSAITMLGRGKPLTWSRDPKEGVTLIQLPDDLQVESGRPCAHAYVFRIEE